MPPDDKPLVLILFSIGAIYCTLWVLDVGGATCALLRGLYRRFGRRLWPYGSEDSYVTFNRYGGCFGIAICVVAIAVALTR